jgi:quercetin dioxygenase-like cupin family protein
LRYRAAVVRPRPFVYFRALCGGGWSSSRRLVILSEAKDLLLPVAIPLLASLTFQTAPLPAIPIDIRADTSVGLGRISNHSPNTKEKQMRLPLALYGVALSVCLVPFLAAQDAAKVDAKHYTVISENDQVRILKVHYGPHEKSVMHHHPDTVAVFLTDANGTFSYPDGKKKDFMVKAGDAQYSVAETHLPENTSDKGMDVIVIELKGKAAHAAKSEMK